jgi:ATP-dependent RNA circularization protein (DNA/RNA ligase family)
MTEKMDSISQEKVEKKDMDYLIREYLVHSGYQESFMALDKEYNPVDLIEENYDDLSWKKDLSEKMALDKKNSFNELERKTSGQMEVDDLPYDIDKLRKYSQDEVLMKEPEMRKRTLSIIMERNNSKLNLLKYHYFKIFPTP